MLIVEAMTKLHGSITLPKLTHLSTEKVVISKLINVKETRSIIDINIKFAFKGKIKCNWAFSVDDSGIIYKKLFEESIVPLP